MSVFQGREAGQWCEVSSGGVLMGADVRLAAASGGLTIVNNRAACFDMRHLTTVYFGQTSVAQSSSLLKASGPRLR